MDFNQKIIEEFRKNKGIVGKPFEHMKLLLVTAKGAKTGKEHTFPVACTMEGDKYIIIASKGGAPDNPAWYYNLVANPEATVEVGTETGIDTCKVRATNITGAERERLYAQHAAQYPQFNDYKAKTTREIPVFTLERI